MRFIDVPAVTGLERAVFPYPWTKNHFFSEITTHCSTNIVAVTTLQTPYVIVGYLCARTVCDECSLHKLATSKGHRRRGIASALMDVLMTEAWMHDARSVHLEVRETNHGAQQFYKTLGFLKTGKRIRYYNESNEDAVIMSRQLREPPAALRD